MLHDKLTVLAAAVLTACVLAASATAGEPASGDAPPRGWSSLVLGWASR